MLDGVTFFPYPYMYRSPWKATKTKTELEICLDKLKHSNLFSDDVAAVIIEPMLGEGGYVPAPKEFLLFDFISALPMLFSQAVDYGNLLIICEPFFFCHLKYVSKLQDQSIHEVY